MYLGGSTSLAAPPFSRSLGVLGHRQVFVVPGVRLTAQHRAVKLQLTSVMSCHDTRYKRGKSCRGLDFRSYEAPITSSGGVIDIKRIAVAYYSAGHI